MKIVFSRLCQDTTETGNIISYSNIICTTATTAAVEAI